MPPTTKANATSNGLHSPEILPDDKEKIHCVYDRAILKRARRYQRKKGLPFVQDVARLALSYFLDREGAE